MHPLTSPTALGPEMVAAFAWVSDLHRDQTRRGGLVPYVSHLLAVAALVLEDGGDETMAIAALLHDAVEDQGGVPVLVEIRERFGVQVAAIVEACTDSLDEPRPAWAERKAAYLAHLRSATLPEPVLTVIAADKLHNARALLADLHRIGGDAWSTFSADPSVVVAYYVGMGELLGERLPESRNALDLRRIATELEAFRVVSHDHPAPA